MSSHLSSVPLHALTADLLLRRGQALRHEGVEVRQHLRPVEVEGDRAEIEDLLAAAIDWAEAPGMRLLVRVELRHWPEHGQLALRVIPAVHLAGEPPGPTAKGPAWERLSALAEGLGVKVERREGEGQVDLVLEFTRTIRRSGALSAHDVDHLGPDTWRMQSQGVPLAGAHVLLLTDDVRVAQAVQAACTQLELDLVLASTAWKAARLCEAAKPDLIVVDGQLHDDTFRQLHADLLHEEMLFPVIEVATGATIPELASWEHRSIHRIGRDDVRRLLPSALALALAR